MKTKTKKYPKPAPIHPSGICYSPGFYKFGNVPIEGYTINQPNFLEDYGFPYENKLAKLMDKLIETTALFTTEDAHELSKALLNIKERNQFIRNTLYSKETLSDVAQDVITEHVTQIENGSENRFTRAQFELATEKLKQEWVDNDQFRKELHNRSLLRSSIDPRPLYRLIYNKLTRGQWMIFKTKINHQFITSDNPGFCLDAQSLVHNTRFGGRSSFFFPLTPYFTLVIFFESDHLGPLPESMDITRVSAEPYQVDFINKATWVMANKEAYAAYDDPLIKTWASLNSRIIMP